MGESARLAPSSGFYVVSSAILSCKSFEIRVNFMMTSLKICNIIDVITFLYRLDPHSMRCSLNLQLRSAHEKPKQPNRFDSPTDPDATILMSL